MAKVEIDASEVMENITLTVRMPRAFGLRMWVASRLIRLAMFLSPVKIIATIRDENDIASNALFDAEDASTWTRYEERTPEGGIIALVRYPEGYRVRHHGEVVWKS